MSSRVLLLAFLGLLVAINTALFGYAYAAALSWLGNSDHRLPNVRLIDQHCRAPFIRKFIALQDWSEPTLVVFGDSQPYNHGIPAENTWPVLLSQQAGLGLKVVNLAVLDGRLADTRFIARQVPVGAAEMSIVNLNQSHFSGRQRSQVPPIEASPLEFARCVWSMRRQLVSTDLPLPDATKARETFRRLELAADRYVMQIDAETVAGMLTAAAKTADKGIAFITPNNLDAFGLYGYDVPRFLEKSSALAAACSATGLTCFDMSAVLNRSHFYDIVHLNTAGNRAFASVLAERLKASLRSVGASSGRSSL